MKPSGICIKLGNTSIPASETAIRDMILEADGTTYENIRSLNQSPVFATAYDVFQRQDVPFGDKQKKRWGLDCHSKSKLNRGNACGMQRLQMVLFRHLKMKCNHLPFQYIILEPATDIFNRLVHLTRFNLQHRLFLPARSFKVRVGAKGSFLNIRIVILAEFFGGRRCHVFHRFRINDDCAAIRSGFAVNSCIPAELNRMHEEPVSSQSASPAEHQHSSHVWHIRCSPPEALLFCCVFAV